VLKNTPRYVIGSGDETYEFPIVRDGNANPRAILAVRSTTFGLALAAALDWAKAYTKTEQSMGGDSVYYPQVSYNRQDASERRLAKKVAGMVWTESESHGAWLPVEALGVV